MTNDDELVKRLRGYYPVGPINEDGGPEFGWRLFDGTPMIQSEAADAIEALQAEQCAVVKPLEWVPDEEFGYTRADYLRAETAIGVVRCIKADVPKLTARHVEAVMRFITLRPVSEVQAEAHAAAIEAAARAQEEAFRKGVNPEKHPDHIRTLHTDASLAYLAERDERIKREAREEALREAEVKLREVVDKCGEDGDLLRIVLSETLTLIEKDHPHD